MDTKFVEAGHGPDGGNWGKFLVGRYTEDELAEPAQFPGCEGSRRLVNLGGPGRQDIWVLDLQTGEGARFPIEFVRDVDVHHQLNKHRIWVCPLYEPFVAFLFGYIGNHQRTWWDTLPRTVEMPTAGIVVFGRRRPGPFPGRPTFRDRGAAAGYPDQ